MSDAFFHRKHIRMPNFDYSTPGAYFFTICLNERSNLFGDVVDCQVQLNEIGERIADIWNSVSDHFRYVSSDEFIVMPDHVHGICILRDSDFDNSPVSFISVVQWFKSITTVEYGKGVESSGWARYNKRLWQRDYFERYLRNERELEQRREYIVKNPLRWSEQRYG